MRVVSGFVVTVKSDADGMFHVGSNHSPDIGAVLLTVEKDGVSLHEALVKAGDHVGLESIRVDLVGKDSEPV